jgi:hypothetical protein
VLDKDARTSHLTTVGANSKVAKTELDYRGTLLIRNRNPPRTATGPHAYAYCRVLGRGVFL